MKKLFVLVLCISIAAAMQAQSNKKVTKIINSIPAIVELVKNKQVIQNILNSGQGIEKGALYNYLNTVTANPGCARLDSFEVLKNDFYTHVNTYNGLITQLQNQIMAVNTVDDFKRLPAALLETSKQFATPVAGIISVNLRAINLAAQTNSCYTQNIIGILKIVGGFLFDALIDYIKETQLKKLKAAIVNKLEELKIDKMDVLWTTAETAVKNKASQVFDNRNMLVQSVPKDSTGEGYTELTFESAVRELGLSTAPGKTCFTGAEIDVAFEATKKIRMELWEDREFYSASQANYERNRLKAAREALRRKYKCP
ncbi:MAG TPA: hypothetical protein VHM26_16715 [Chitinophagaceae bacterium]|jgi:hypothetical protein|nr:hypothetical protein [Chitinophagaceae bacterium]